MTDITANEYRTAAKVCAAEEDWSRAKALRELADLIDANDARDAEREARHLASKLAHDAEITALAIIQMEGESGWWRGVECDKFADRTYESMTGDNQQAIRSGVSAVLAHLQSTGRLIPAGGMALTAEQVEDVRKVLGKATTEYGAMELTAAWARLRALFPATEPAEEVKEPRRLPPSNDCCLYKTNECFIDHPAPAGPAEEETKAEAVEAAINMWVETAYQTTFAGLGHSDTELAARKAIGEMRHLHLAEPWLLAKRITDILSGDTLPSSSPVVPAPTETGPWQTWQEVPEGVKYWRSEWPNPTLAYWVNRGGVRFYADAAIHEPFPSDTSGDINLLAPFVAAEER